MNIEIDYKDYSEKKIIVIDDDMLNLNIAAKFLEPYNIKAEKVSSGFQLLEKIKAGEIYDLIIMDDMMPEMSGTKTMQKLKSNPLFTTPIVVLTGNNVDGAKEEYLKAGFDDYIEKPIKKEEYDRILKTFLK